LNGNRVVFASGASEHTSSRIMEKMETEIKTNTFTK